MNRRPMLPLLTVLIALSLAGCASNQNLRSPSETSWQPSSETASDSATANRLWQVFERYEGTPYRYGGTSASGFDCSGFIATAFDEALGRRLPRTTSQMLSAGDVVKRDQLQAGDLVFSASKAKTSMQASTWVVTVSFTHPPLSASPTRHSTVTTGVTVSATQGGLTSRLPAATPRPAHREP